MKQASLNYTMPPAELHPPDGLDRDAIVAWAMLAWSQDYPEYLHLFLEGGVLMGADIGQLPMPGIVAAQR